MKTINKIILFTLAIVTFSCDDILEDDISNDTAQIIAPTNGTIIESNVANFQWNGIDGADEYRVQVYGSNQSIVLDSLVSQTQLTYSLPEGTYQWRVRGENFAYQSTYSFSASFSMVESSVLTNQQVILYNPSNDTYTNDTSVICTWQPINTADYYELELVNMTSGQVVYQQSNITHSSVTISNTYLTEDAKYQWKIKAVNSTSQTPFSSRIFSIDRQVPNQPVNGLPASNTTLSPNESIDFSLSLSSPVDTGMIQSPILYTIEFANSTTFAAIIQTSSSSAPTPFFSHMFTSSGDYYWRIIAKDGAGNNSVYSDPFKFTIN